MSRSSQRLLKRKSLVPDSRNLCRLCLSKERRLTRFFSNEHGTDNDLLRKIYDCTTVEVDHFDVFPVAICSLCEQQLSDWYRFREKCVENDTILHNLFGMERSRKAAHRGDIRFLVGDKPNPPPAEPTLQYASEIDEEEADEVHSEQHNGPAIAAPVDETEPSSTTQTTVLETPESMVTIALTQLSTLGVRPRKDPDAPEPVTSTPSCSMGMIRVAKNLLVSQQHQLQQQQLQQQQQQQQQDEGATTLHGIMPPLALDHVRHLSAHKLMGLSVQLDDGRFQCMVCKRTFRNAYTLKRHLKLHTEENLYECEYCGKRFNDRSNWKIHQRAHTGDNLYNCLVCLKSFISPSTLKYHRRAHRKLRSFDCRVCQESFNEYEELEAHMRDAHRGVALEDLQMDEPLLDAANFVKIELEDEEQQQQQQLDTTQEPRNSADSSGLLVTGSDIEEGDDGEEESGHGRRDEECRLVGPSEEALIRHQPHHPHPLSEHPRDEQMILDGSRREPLVVETAADIPIIPVQPPVDIKQELPDVVKQEPFDEDMIVTDPRELLMMEEASEGQEEEKESNRGTVILFRCDYCMQIFHFLDDLNAHMELHNGANGSSQNGGGVVLGSAAAIPHQAQPAAPDGRPPSLLKPLMLRNVGTSEHGGSSVVTGATRLHPMHGNMQIVYPRSTQPDIRPAPAPATNRTPPDQCQSLLFLSPTANGAGGLKRRHSFEPDVADLMNVTPPEHQCTKCSKRFRTEELLRVHEATHENDALVNRVRSCRICNKVFKCELNLQAHMRKHNTTQHHTLIKFSGSSGDDDQHPEGSGGGPGDGARSGSESASSSSAGENEGGSKEDRQPPAEAADGGASSESLGDSEGEVGLTSSESSTGNGSLAALTAAAAAAAGAGRKGPVRKCEICAISFEDATYLEQHVLSHFARNEAVSFIPSADRPFKCTECHKRFKRKDYLLIHIRTHTGERRYKCDLCSSAFVHPSNLITHRKLHSNERPHKCDLCKATFKLYAGLKIHRRRCVMKNLSDSFSFGDDGAASSAETDPNAAGAAAGTSVRLVQSAGRLSL